MTGKKSSAVDLIKTYAFDINSMFAGCASLNYLPDISNWKTNKARSMHGLFDGCSSLKTLPDLSKWDISEVRTILYHFWVLSIN